MFRRDDGIGRRLRQSAAARRHGAHGTLSLERLESRQNPSGLACFAVATKAIEGPAAIKAAAPAGATALGALQGRADLSRRFTGGSDVFTFATLGPGGSADRVSLDFDRTSAALRFDLYDATGGLVGSVPPRDRGQSELRMLGLPAGDYAVVVSGGDTAVDYRLRIDAPPAPLQVDDRYEPNNTRTDARAIGAVAASKTVLAILADDDWYKISVRSAGSYDVVLSSKPAFRTDAVLEVVDDAGRILAASSGPGGVQAVRGLSLAAGTAYLHVTPGSGRPIDRYTLTVTRVGGAAPGTPPATPLDRWVDRNVTDAALKPLVLAAAQDGGITRGEMIGILGQAAQGGTVTKREFASLKAVVQNTTVIQMPDDVRNLAGKTVLGDPANRTYQGQPLGDLAVGSPGSRLTDLVGKWFLGNDPPRGPIDSTTGQPKYPLETATGTLFGPSGKAELADINQGNLGDCYFLSSLGTMVSKGSPVVALRTADNPDGMFILNDDGTVTVRFHYKKQAAAGKRDRADGTWVADYVTVNNQFPVGVDGGKTTWEFANAYAPFDVSAVLWVAYAEKAFVQENTSQRWGTSDTKNVYGDVSGLYNANITLMALSGQDGYKNTTDLSGLTFQGIVDSYTKGVGVVFGTRSTIPIDTKDDVPIVTGHDYMMIGYDQARQTIRLRNPWGVLGTSGTYDAVNPTSPAGTTLYIDATVQLLQDVFDGYYHV